MSPSSDILALVADFEARAQRFETPCGAGSLLWRRWGEGPPLVLTHGAQGACLHWIRNIDALAAERTVWAVDLPGSGESADPPEPTHRAISDILAEGLRQLLGPRLPVDIAGFSFGGVCAAYLAADYPELVRRLVLVDTGGLDTPLGPIRLTRMRGLEGEARREAMKANLLGLMLHHPDSADDLAIHLQTMNVPRGRLNTVDLVMPRRLQDVLPRITTQVDAIWGEHDIPHPDPALQAAALRQDQPDADVRVIEGAGHWAMYERPAAFNRALLDLLNQPLRSPSAHSRRQFTGWSVRWDPARAAQAYRAGHWVRETLADAARRAAEDTPERVMLVEGDVSLDARSLYDQAASLAGALLARGKPGEVVSFMLPNWREAAVIYLASTLAGMVSHPILPSLRDHDLQFVLEDVGSRLLFIPREHRGHDYVAMLDRVTERMASPPEVVVLRGDAGGHTPYSALLDGPPPTSLPLQEADAVRMVLYTSGSTGRPKGVLHSHNTLHALMGQIAKHRRVEPGDSFLVASPISHIGGSIYAFEAPLLLGVRTVLMDQWDPKAALDIMAAQGCTHMGGATPFLEQLLAAAEPRGEHLPALKHFICGGASVPPSLIRRATAWFETATVTRVYGSTEAPITTVGARDRDDVWHAAETEGRVGYAEVRLTDAKGDLVDEGEVRVRGPQLLAGYLHPEDEVEAFDEDGFFRTGDIARWVDGDYLVICGRAKDIIIRNGENIAPKEVEDILVNHPAIAEVAIVGVPDARTGERACAVIVPKPGLAAPTVADLRDFLKYLGVAAFKIPEAVAVRDSLPKNDAGKVLKHEIKAALADAP